MSKATIPVTLPPYLIHYTLNADQLSERLPWSIQKFGINKYWPAAPVSVDHRAKVAIVDTGFDRTHVNSGDLHGVVEGMFDCVGGGVFDANGHGSHVAGTVAAVHNGFGVAGVAANRVTLISCRALDANGAGSDKSVADGLNKACDEGAHVINCSLGSSQPSQRIKSAVDRCEKEGRILICAAGNDGPGPVGWPAAYPYAGATGAVDTNDIVATFSSRGQQVDYAAPGVEILSCFLGGRYSVLSGTSMASPWMTGLAAVMVSLELEAGNWQTRSSAAFLAKMHALNALDDLGTQGRDPDYGDGRPIPEKIMVAATTPGPGPAPGQPSPLEVTIPAIVNGQSATFRLDQ